MKMVTFCMEKLTLTRKEAAELLGISTATLTQWVKTGRLRAIKMSDKEKSRYLFTREDCIASLKLEQNLPSPAQVDIPHQSIDATMVSHNSHKKSDVSKRLDEMLKQRSTNAKRRSD